VVYYIVSDGAQQNAQGCVLARNATGVVNQTCLGGDASFVVQTNYDWWLPVPWFDNRMLPATQMLQQMGRTGVSIANLLNLLSTKPVLNQMTAFSALGIPTLGNFTVLQRWCNEPCPF